MDRYSVGDYVRVVKTFGILGRPQGVYRVAGIWLEEYDGQQILRVSLEDSAGCRRSVFYEDCEKASTPGEGEGEREE